MKHKFQSVWRKINTHLNNAFNILSNNKIYSSDMELKKYISHNEFELALDRLEIIGNANDVHKEFWKELFKAAKLMKLENKQKQYLSNCK